MSEDKKVNIGGFAFPFENKCEHGAKCGVTFKSSGMTLRQWFAGQAVKDINAGIGPEGMAKWSYEVADAMIKEGEK